MTRQLSELGERGIYNELLVPRYESSVPSFGDDCALVDERLVMTTDSCPTPLVEQLGMTDPYYAGWLLATINLSDLAAAGAQPLGLVVNYTLPKETDELDLDRLMHGVDECAASHGTKVLGGDIRDGAQRHLSATAVGRTGPSRRWQARRLKGRLSRRGARAGDALLLAGNPGYLWAAAIIYQGLATVDEQARAAIFELASKPVAQLAAGRLLAKRGLATAAVDVSDGLYASVRLLAESNGLGAELDGTIELDPVLRQVCESSGISDFQLGQNWGDWCLLVTVPPDRATAALNLLCREGVSARRIGHLVGGHRELRLGAGEVWEGLAQERFSDRSWQGQSIADHIEFMYKQSR